MLSVAVLSPGGQASSHDLNRLAVRDQAATFQCTSAPTLWLPWSSRAAFPQARAWTRCVQDAFLRQKPLLPSLLGIRRLLEDFGSEQIAWFFLAWIQVRTLRARDKSGWSWWLTCGRCSWALSTLWYPSCPYAQATCRSSSTMNTWGWA